MNTASPLLELNQLSLDLVAADFSNGHSPTQGGPTKTSRALAIIHLAIHDAFARVSGAFQPRLANAPLPPTGLQPTDENLKALIGGACFAACRALYPDESARIQTAADTYHARHTPTVASNSPAEMFGVAIASAWLQERAADGSNTPGRYQPSNQPGAHRPDPVNPGQGSLHPAWGFVRPFVLAQVATDAPLAPPPALNSKEYAEAFDQVAVHGHQRRTSGDSVARDEAVTGIFWGYDGANRLGTPPRLYNQVIRQVVQSRIDNGQPVSLANAIRLFTAINVAMADAGIAAWYWKYVYNLWRPVVGIREADAGWGPTGIGDGNNLRKESGDPFWVPVGAPATNAPVARENFTPNFPAYPSGHATFGSACFETAASFFKAKPEDIEVGFTSDEWNGISTDNRGVVRPALSRVFTLREGIEQNNISRVFLGVHWIFDATGGEAVGHAIAQKVAAAFPSVS